MKTQTLRVQLIKADTPAEGGYVFDKNVWALFELVSYTSENDQGKEIPYRIKFLKYETE